MGLRSGPHQALTLRVPSGSRGVSRVHPIRVSAGDPNCYLKCPNVDQGTRAVMAQRRQRGSCASASSMLSKAARGPGPREEPRPGTPPRRSGEPPTPRVPRRPRQAVPWGSGQRRGTSAGQTRRWINVILPSTSRVATTSPEASKAVEDGEDLPAGGMAPPASMDRLAGDVLREIRQRPASGLQNDALLAHPRQRIHAPSQPGGVRVRERLRRQVGRWSAVRRGARDETIIAAEGAGVTLCRIATPT